MDVYTLARIKSRYPVDGDSDYSPTPAQYVDSLLQWPSNGYANSLQNEKSVLWEALTISDQPNANLADQVFGRHAHEQKLSMRHTANLLSHRHELHKRHVRDLDRRIMQVQVQLSIARQWATGLPSRQEVDLEKLLMKLEQDRREEDTAFWKDTVKIRQELLSGAKEYQATRHRAELLRPLEGDYGGLP